MFRAGGSLEACRTPMPFAFSNGLAKLRPCSPTRPIRYRLLPTRPLLEHAQRLVGRLTHAMPVLGRPNLRLFARSSLHRRIRTNRRLSREGKKSFLVGNCDAPPVGIMLIN